MLQNAQNPNAANPSIWLSLDALYIYAINSTDHPGCK